MIRTSIYFRYFICAIFLFVSLQVDAQLHFKVGFTSTYFQPEENNKLLQAYNDRNQWLSNKFNDLKWAQGLDAGLRYRIGFVGIEASWRASFANTIAEGRDPLTDSDFQKKLIYRFNTYSFGVENYIRNFGIGVSLGYNRMSIKERTTDDRFNVLKTNQWTGTIFLGVYSRHDGSISFGLRPFVQLPIDQFNISELATTLGEPSTDDLLEKEYLTFGLSLVIFNGY